MVRRADDLRNRELLEGIRLFTDLGRDEAETARLLHVDEATVRAFLATGQPPQRQLELAWEVVP